MTTPYPGHHKTLTISDAPTQVEPRNVTHHVKLASSSRPLSSSSTSLGYGRPHAGQSAQPSNLAHTEHTLIAANFHSHTPDCSTLCRRPGTTSSTFALEVRPCVRGCSEVFGTQSRYRVGHGAIRKSQ